MLSSAHAYAELGLLKYARRCNVVGSSWSLIAIRYGWPAPRLASIANSFSAASKSICVGSPGIVSAVDSLGESDIFHAFGAPRLVSHLRCGRSAELNTSVPSVVPAGHL